MQRFDNTLITVKEKLTIFAKGIELIRLLYIHSDHGGVTNPMDELPEKSKSQGAPERLAELKSAGFIDFDEGSWQLEQPVIDFIESIAGLGGEVNVQTIIGNHEKLKKEVEYFFLTENDDDKARALTQVRRTLKKLLKNIRNTLERIDLEIRNDYVTTSDINLKIQKLKDHQLYLEQLDTEIFGNKKTGEYIGILTYLNHFILDEDPKFSELRPLFLHFISSFNSFYIVKKSSILRRLRDYMSRIEKIDKPARKIEQICKLLINGQLFSTSNISTVIKTLPAPVQNIRDLKLNLDSDLNVDDYNKNIASAVQGFNLETGESFNPAPIISREQRHKKAPQQAVNYFLKEVQSMFEAYRLSPEGTFLSDFVIAYDGFSDGFSFERRIVAFTEAVNVYRSEVKGSPLNAPEYLLYTHESNTYRLRKFVLNKKTAHNYGK